MKKFIALAFSLLFCVAQAGATISNVTETHSSTSITLTWNTSLPEFNPVVKYSQGSGCSLTMTATGTSDCRSPQTVTISGLAPGTQYCLRPQGQFCSGLSTDLGDTLLVTTNSSDTPTVTRTSTVTRTVTPTTTPTRTISQTFTVSPTVTATPSSTATPTASPSATRTATPTVSPTPTATGIATYTNLKVVKDAGVIVFTGEGSSYVIPMAKQPVQILNVYFRDLTASDFPNVSPDNVMVEPAEYADAINSATADIIYSYDMSSNFLFTDNGSSLLTTGHSYRVTVQYLTSN